jgi:DNA-binding MarR family transcriptional regulator
VRGMGTKREDLESLRKAIDQLVRVINRVASQSLDYGRFEVLQLVATHGSVPTAQIGEALDMAPSVVVRCLRVLEEAQLAIVVDDDDDEPVAVATRAGCDELRQVTDTSCDILAAVMRDWDPDEIRGLSASLTRLSADWQTFQQASALKVRATP